MDFVFQNNNVKTCGYIYKINDYTFDPAFVYFARDDSYYEGFDWENFLKDYPFYPITGMAARSTTSVGSRPA